MPDPGQTNVVAIIAGKANNLLAAEYARTGTKPHRFVDMAQTWAVLQAYLDWMKEEKARLERAG